VKHALSTGIATAAVLLALATAVNTQAPPATPVSSQQALLNQYCRTCHNDRLKTGGLALSSLNLDDRATLKR
jgi:hypothetical protein